MTAVNHTLAKSDQIMATLQSNGKVIANITKTNFTSIDDVVRFISNLAGKFFGLAKLTIRNHTQGWIVNMALSKRSPIERKSIPALASYTSGQQLSIPW